MLLRNLATALLEHGRIETTLAKAKEVQPFAEKLISLAREGFNLNNFRRVLAVVTKKEVAYRLFHEIGPRYSGRPGGYTRIFKLAKVRQGDAAPMGVITSLLLMATLPIDTWIRLVVWMAIGLVIYFAYGVRHSRLGTAKATDLDASSTDCVILYPFVRCHACT